MMQYIQDDDYDIMEQIDNMEDKEIDIYDLYDRLYGFMLARMGRKSVERISERLETDLDELYNNTDLESIKFILEEIAYENKL